MDEVRSLLNGFAVALTWYNVGLMAVGIVIGVIVGVLPGLGGPNGVAILLPLTFTMAPTRHCRRQAPQDWRLATCDGERLCWGVAKR